MSFSWVREGPHLVVEDPRVQHVLAKREYSHCQVMCCGLETTRDCCGCSGVAWRMHEIGKPGSKPTADGPDSRLPGADKGNLSRRRDAMTAVKCVTEGQQTWCSWADGDECGAGRSHLAADASLVTETKNACADPCRRVLFLPVQGLCCRGSRACGAADCGGNINFLTQAPLKDIENSLTCSPLLHTLLYTRHCI